MKDATGAVTRSGTLTLEDSEALTIHEGAVHKLMALFSNQYGNKALAAIREYWCNGDDSRRAAGSDRPTEATLPTDLNPTLVIRDYGLGLTKDEIFSVFSTYGQSTKDDSNEDTGHFGIGSKAAFTLSTEFVVTGYKDGQMATVLFFLDEHGGARRSVRHEGPTNEPNGVRVQVACPDVESMQIAAEEFFQDVPKGRALVNGEPPVHRLDKVEHERFNDDVLFLEDGLGRIQVQMGPVVYPVSHNIRQQIFRRLREADDGAAARVAESLLHWPGPHSVLMEVEMGSLTLAPSREDLRDTEATLNRLTEVVRSISDYIYRDVQKQVDAAPSHYQASMVLHHAMSRLRGFGLERSQFTFKKKKGDFSAQFKIEQPMFKLGPRSYASSQIITQSHSEMTMTPERAERTLVVTGVNEENIGSVRRYVKRFLESFGDTEEERPYDYVLAVEEERGAFGWFQFGVKAGAATMALDEWKTALKEIRAKSRPNARVPMYATGFRSQHASADPLDRDSTPEDIVGAGLPVVLYHAYAYVRRAREYQYLNNNYTAVVLTPSQSRNALLKRMEEAGGVPAVLTPEEAHAKYLEYARGQIPEPTEKEREVLGAKAWLRANGWQIQRHWTTVLKEDLPAEGWDRVKDLPAVRDAQDTLELVALMAEPEIDRVRRDEIQEWITTFQQAEADALEVDAGFLEDDLPQHYPLLVDGVNAYEIRRNEAYREALIEYLIDHA